ncbi:transporter substrate-binding domain-containing protein [Streptococcus gallolyticus]|uniref:transporter substrate-binding domain-containing protein n=1 Tax=Streptococcus hepaticus TaxID=3349163 RepID=UPI001C974E62|nr:transporter substrate-binding domain-containing protein [Streptococcus gallolyticus]MBY5042008.1 transporter substrate-binding domain-containing protein [Streptococcus gallolyticus]
MKFKKLLVAATALVAGLSLAACSSGASTDKSVSTVDKIKEKGTLVVATSPDYAPFEFQALVDGENKVVGADILLAEKLAKDLGVKLEVSAMSFDNVLTSVQNGKADIAIAGFSYSKERAQSFDFTDAYYSVSDVFLVKKSDADKYKKLSDLKGKSLAVQKGSTQEAFAQKSVSDANIVSLTAMGEEVNELKSGQVDAVLMDSAVAEGYASQNDDLVLASIKLEASDADAKVVIMPKGQEDLQKVLNKSIKEVVDGNEFANYLSEVAKYKAVE